MKKFLPLCLAILLCGCGEEKSTSDLIDQLRHQDAARRLEAVRELGQRPETQEVVPALIGALKDGNSYVRRDAAVVLGKLGADARPGVTALLAAHKDRERRVRRAVAEALKQIDPQAASRAGIR
jgi:HEAT repeat protein